MDTLFQNIGIRFVRLCCSFTEPNVKNRPVLQLENHGLVAMNQIFMFTT